MPIGFGTTMFSVTFARSQAATSLTGFDVLIFSSRTTRSSTVGLRSSCDTARCRSFGSIDWTPRRKSPESVGDAIAMPACDTYFFGHTLTVMSPARMQNSSGPMNHHRRRWTTDM